MTYPTHLFPTTVVGSYPQPDWLVDRERLMHRVPRVRAPEIWRFEGATLEAAQDDATILAIREMERAGIDIVTDGEMRRESYSNRFALTLEGVDADTPGQTIGRTGGVSVVPRVVGRIRRRGPVERRDAEFLRANATRATKITLPGPFTMSMQAKNEFYDDEEEMATDYAIAVNEELKDLKATGVDVVQLDEPWMQARPEQATRYGVRVLNRALEGVAGPVVVHLCFGYAHVVHDKPHGYSFLPQLADSAAQQISIEFGAAEARSRHAARSRRQDDPARRARSRARGRGEAARDCRSRAARARSPGRRAAGARAGLRHEISAARARLREAEGDGGRGRPSAQGARRLTRTARERRVNCFRRTVAGASRRETR